MKRERRDERGEMREKRRGTRDGRRETGAQSQPVLEKSDRPWVAPYTNSSFAATSSACRGGTPPDTAVSATGGAGCGMRDAGCGMWR